MKYAFIEQHREQHTVQMLCEVMAVSASGYYQWRRNPVSQRQLDDEIFAKHIKQVFDESDQTYGNVRIWKELQSCGITCGKHRIARLMKENGWVVKQQKRFKVTTKSDPTHRKAPNELQRDFKATVMNKKWTTDITYIHTREGWLFLAVVLDLFSRRIVGWAMDKTMEKQLVLDALAMAVAQRSPPEKLLHHSDRGSQYTSTAYQAELARLKMTASMSGKGDCWDNAVTESFFGTLKTERVHRRDYATRAEAKRDIFSYIEGFYNTRRRHSTLNYESPANYERLYGRTSRNMSSVSLH